MPIRIATGADAEQVTAIYAPYVEQSAVSFESVVPSIEEMAARISDRQPAYPWLVAEDGDRRVVGYAYAGRFAARAAYSWSVETSVYVAEAARRRGVGRGLYTALFQILAAQGYRRAFGGIALPNAPSVALHESMGFTPSGVYRAVGWKFGAWHDVGWWQRSLGATDAEPQPPRPYTDLPVTTLHGALATGAVELS
jgi:phosphinothricin acetyltransferase